MVQTEKDLLWPATRRPRGVTGRGMTMFFQRNPNIRCRRIHETWFLIDITQNYDDICRLYEINEMGNFIWEQLERPVTVDGITDAILAVVIGEVDRETVRRDVAEFLAPLQARGYVEEREAWKS